MLLGSISITFRVRYVEVLVMRMCVMRYVHVNPWNSVNDKNKNETERERQRHREINNFTKSRDIKITNIILNPYGKLLNGKDSH